MDAFYMAICEVTNQHYADGLNWALAHGLITVMSGGVCRPTGWTDYLCCDTTTSNSFSRITWNGSAFDAVAGRENHPMVMVSWYGSAAYCDWRSAMAGLEPCFNSATWECDFAKDGDRLATEAEWEKAAGAGATLP
jgi:formylglycine-generating enzyme required for sulfatase activity